MKNLQALIFPTVAILWILLLWGCSTMLVKVHLYRLKSTLPTDQKNIIRELEEKRTRAILLEKQRTLAVQIQEVDGLSFQPYKKQALTELESLNPLSTLIQTKIKQQMLSGHISDTVGKTTIDLWSN